MSRMAANNKALYVKQLNPSTTAEDLKRIFGKAGQVKNAMKVSPQSALVFFYHAEHAQKAIDLFHGCSIDGRNIHVSYKTDKKGKPSKTRQETSALEVPSSDDEDTTKDSLTMDIEKLRYMKARKLTSKLVGTLHATINIDAEASEVIVEGSKKDVQQLLSKIRQSVGQFPSMHSPVTEVFAQAFATIHPNEVIAEFKRNKVVAGWSLRHGDLHICSGTMHSAKLASELIHKMVTECVYPVTGHLSDGEIQCITQNPEWNEFLKKLNRDFKSFGLEMKFVESSRQLHIALKASEDKIAVLTAFERFFGQFKIFQGRFSFNEEMTPLILKNKDYYLKLAAQEGVTVAFDHLESSGYCTLKSQSKEYIDSFKCKLNRLVKELAQQTHKYQKPGEVAWLKSVLGKKRLEEISTLSQTVFSSFTEFPQGARNAEAVSANSPQKISTFSSAPTYSVSSSVKSKMLKNLKIITGDIAEIEADGLVSSRGAIERSIRRKSLSKHSLQPGLQSVPMSRSAIFKPVLVYHLQTLPWNNTEAREKELEQSIRKAFEAFRYVNHIAIPVIGVGNLGYPPEKVAKIMIGTLQNCMDNSATENQTVTIVVHPEAHSVQEAFQLEFSRYKRAVRATPLAVPTFQHTEQVRITFKGVELACVEKAFERLEMDLKCSMSSVDWLISPNKGALGKLSQQEVDYIYAKAIRKNLEIRFELDKQNIWLEGLKDDVTSMKELINLILHKKSTSTLPSHWDQTEAAKRSGRVELQQSSSEYRKVMRKFHETSEGTAIQVFQIIRIQNEELYAQYEAQKKKVEKALKGDKSYAIEAQLWHGTSVESMKQICAHGFNRSYAGKNAVAYGHGTYFSTNSKYSITFCSGQGEKCIILAKVVTGRYKLGNSSTTTKNLPEGYHSTADSESNPTKYVVYHDAAAYPEYVIHFGIE